jgi:hypothetical protein
MLVKVSPFTGINKDLSQSDLPIGAVTDAQNVRFREGCAEMFLGQADAYPTAPIAPYSAFPVQLGTDRYWLVLGANKAYAVTGNPAVWTNITRQTAAVDVNYAADLRTLWNGGVLNGVPIVNNGVDDPQMWSPIGTGTKLQKLSDWPANTKARTLRFFNYCGFAFDVTQGGTRYPHRVLFSSPAEAGTVPTSWDVADPTEDAGQQDLPGSDFVIDGLTLRQSMIVYKENSTFVCSFVGGDAKYGFTPLFTTSGMLSADCAVEVDGAHYVLTASDVIRHDGSSVNSILDKATRRWLFRNIDPVNFERCFLTRNIYFNEVWVCFPQVGQTSCTQALVYNYKDGTTSLRELPSVTSASVGLVDGAVGNTIDGRTLPIDMYTGAIDEVEFGAQLQRTMLCAPGRPALVLTDNGYQNFGVNITASIERVGLAFDAPNQLKTVTKLYPRVLAAAGTVMQFRVGGSMDVHGTVTWSEWQDFIVGTHSSVDLCATGKFLAYGVRSTAAYAWKLEGLDMNIIPRGTR